LSQILNVMKKTVLITGGTGYIGSHTVVELQTAGYEVVVVDDLSNSKENVIAGIEQITGDRPRFYKIDLTNKEASREVFKNHKIDAVIHFAASKAVGESVENPLHYYQNNLGSLLNILALMKQYDCDHLVFSSSCTVYGQPEKLPVTEDTPIQPAASPYGNTKQIGEEIIKDTINSNDKLSAISLRYFNPIGAHDSGLIGELPQGVPNNLVPYLLKVVGGELEQLSVFGGDYDTKDGTCIRDYIHVVDLAKAHLIAVDKLLEKKSDRYEVFNLGTGEGYSVLDLIKTFQEATGETINYKIVDRRPGDIEQIYADTQNANDNLGWKAERDLKNMLSTAWKWQQYLMKKKLV
jgi:UDP-glucose 4-epimerase